jgi:fructoselysine-6-P-deglycase FrlB-like protein
MAKTYAALREEAGQGETDAFQASEFPLGRAYDRVVAITRSGTTTEVIDLLTALSLKGTTTTVITADPGRAAAALATHAIVLDFADEQSVVQTRFATSALALLRAHLGEDIGPIACDAEVAVRLPLPVHPGVEQITFLGRGWTIGLAEEAALKCREAATFWAEAYPAMDYRHGPISIAAPGRVVWAFGEIPAHLAEDVEATGAAFVHARHHGGHAALGRWSGGRSPLDPMADLIVAQRVAVHLATSQGLDPDQPRNLTRSVVLT